MEQGRADVQGRLATLAAQRQPVAQPPAAATGVVEVGIEEIGLEVQAFAAVADRERFEAAPAQAPLPEPPAEPGAEDLASAAPAPGLPRRVDESEFDLGGPEPDTAAPADPSEGSFEEEFFAALDASVASTAAGAAAHPATVNAPVCSPLFEDFTELEFLAVAGQLKLLSFGPGDIVVSEGEPGDSLFVLTTGAVKVFVRSAAGRQSLVRELGEGAFFGEISILSGGPRTATVTCSTRCELLELDRASLEEICRTHPRVRTVLQAFHDQRHGSREERVARAAQAPR
jgi:hypothetical protein